jgi:Transposase DDE domain
MFLRAKRRIKDGKEHRYWSVVENRRVGGGKTIQRQVLYLGELGGGQHAQWSQALEAFDEGAGRMRQIALFADDRAAPEGLGEAVQVRLKDFELHRPRHWGSCWLALDLWEQLQLDAFWQGRLPPSRKGTSWLNVLKTLTCYRLIDPGSEWRLHRQWWDASALGDLLGEDAALAESHKLYRCLDKLVEHKEALFKHLQERWKTLFNPRFDVLLYDLTSTYFECDPPADGKRKHGYSRDRRPDCVQVVIALIVTPEGFPLAYEVLAGNTSDKTTLGDFLAKIEKQYGKADRIWVMDRGIPTEETLAKMRASSPPVSYLVGTPKGRLTALEKDFLGKPWSQAREAVSVKLLEQEGEVYILAKSEGRVLKERAMRRKKIMKFWARLKELLRQAPSRDQLLLKIGAAQKEAGRAASLVTVKLPKAGQPVTPETFTFTLNRQRLRACRRHEGRYLLRSNLVGKASAELWAFYIQLTEVEQAFKELKGDLAIRPVYHQSDERIEAHIFVAFLAYCLQVTLKQRLRALAPGLTPRAVLEKFAAIQMLDVHFPTTDGRTLIFTRHTQPEKDHQLLLQQLKLRLPPQPPPRIAKPKTAHPAPCGADF